MQEDHVCKLSDRGHAKKLGSVWSGYLNVCLMIKVELCVLYSQLRFPFFPFFPLFEARV